MDVEESFMRQKARVTWIQEGDMNTNFFHSMVAVKQNRQAIRSILDDQGQLLDSQDLIASEVIQFFAGLLGSTDDVVRSCSVAL
ncbi:hypothetical protein V6N13_089675 [Hibiscus sabdariffa]